MSATPTATSHARPRDEARKAIGRELRRIRQDEGVSLRALGAACGVDPSHLARAELGRHSLSTDALVAAADVLGCDVSVRLFPRRAPTIRDRLQVLMLDALLGSLHHRWTPRLEVAVYRPVRGVIDVVLVDSITPDLVAGEGHSQLHTVEGQLRWAGQKADALPSAAGYPWADRLDTPPVGRLLLLRSCAATHALVRDAPNVFRAAYPGDTRMAVAALTGKTERWPGAAIVWVEIDGKSSRLLQGEPRRLRT